MVVSALFVAVALFGSPAQSVPLIMPVLSEQETRWLEANERVAFVVGMCERFHPGAEGRMKSELGARLASRGALGEFFLARMAASFQSGKAAPSRLERTQEDCRAEIAAAVSDIPRLQPQS